MEIPEQNKKRLWGILGPFAGILKCICPPCFACQKQGQPTGAGIGGLSDTKNSIFQLWKKFLENFIENLPPPLNIIILEKNLEKFVWKCIICTTTIYSNFFWKIPIPPYYFYLKKFYRKILVNLTINWYLVKKLGGLLLVKQSPLYLCLDMCTISYNLLIGALSTVYLYAF